MKSPWRLTTGYVRLTLLYACFDSTTGHEQLACSMQALSWWWRPKTAARRRESGSEGVLGRKESLLASSLPRPSSFFPRSPAARRTAPPTEVLEQASEQQAKQS